LITKSCETLLRDTLGAGVLNQDVSPENLRLLMIGITIALLVASVVIWILFQRAIGKGKGGKR
jgi:hypothetical protein